MLVNVKVTFAAIFGSIVLLSACGGGGASSPSLDELITRGDALEAEFDGLDWTDPTTLPAGSATYNGVLAMVVDTEAGLFLGGEMRLNANFGMDTVGGDVRNLVDSDDNRYGGTLLITNGEIDRTVNLAEEYTFIADIGGSLSEGGDTYLVNGIMLGDFIGTDYIGVEGIAVGTFSGADQNSVFGGGFIGKR